MPAFAKELELELEPAAHSRLVVAIGLPELPLQVRLLEREVNLQLGDVQAIPFADGTFDTAGVHLVVMHDSGRSQGSV